MQLLDFKLWRNYLVKKSLLLVAIAFVLQIAACSSHNLGADDNQNINNNSLIIEPASIVPVIDGKATAAGVYVHNYSNETLENITYEATITDSTKENLSVAPHQCASIAANSSCLLMFYTPTLTQQYDSGSTLLTAHFNGYKSKQIINYSYIASKNYSGVSFNGDLTIPGTGKYGTVYAFGGQQASFRNVGFYPENSSIGIVNGLENGHVNIRSNEVIPLEIKAAENITAIQVSLTPYLEDEINFKQLSSEEELGNVIHSQQTQKSLQAGNIQDVTIIPEFRANLVIGAVPTLNAEKESNAIVTIANNGVTAASDLKLAVLPGETAITISKSDVTNPCSNSLAAGASCNFRVNLLNNNSSGSTSVIVTYNNGISTDSSSANVSYYNSAKVPMVSAAWGASVLLVRSQETGQIGMTINNSGSAPLNSPEYSLFYTGNLDSAMISATFETTNCKSVIPIGNKQYGICSNLVKFSIKEAKSGNMFLRITGQYAGQTYSFISKPLLVKPVSPKISSYSPIGDNISTSTIITLNFSESMDPLTLNTSNIHLLKSSESKEVALTSLGVSNNNQTVNFKLTSGTLSENTKYDIFYNGTAILSSSGVAIDSSDSNKYLGSFTTGLQSKFMLINDNSIYSLDWASMNNSLNGLTPISRAPNDYNNITLNGSGKWMAISGTHNGNMITTSLDGNTWDRSTQLPKDIAMLAPDSTVKVFCPNLYDHPCLMFKNSHVWRSTDNGNNWTLLDNNDITNVRDFACADKWYCAIAGTRLVNNVATASLWLSTDRGLSWKLITSLPNSNNFVKFFPYSVAFVPGTSMLVVGGYEINKSPCSSVCPVYIQGAIYSTGVSSTNGTSFTSATIASPPTTQDQGKIDDSVAFRSIGCMRLPTDSTTSYCFATTQNKNQVYISPNGDLGKFTKSTNATFNKSLLIKKIKCLYDPSGYWHDNYCFMYALDDDNYEYLLYTDMEDELSVQYNKSKSITNNPLTDFAIFDRNSILGVGTNGRIAKASFRDNFRDIVSPSPAPLGTTLQMVCAATNCVRSYFINNNHQLEYSSDSGVSWTNSTGIPAFSTTNKLFAINKSTFLAVTNDKIYRSSNNGSSWSNVLSSLNANSGVSCTRNTCYVVTSNQKTKVSSDGGLIWSDLTVPNNFPVSGLNNLYCWGTACFNVNSENRSVYRSNNNLATWDVVSLPITAYIANISCSVSSNYPDGYCLALGVSLGSKTVVMKSVDSGLTWSQIIFSDSDTQYYNSLTCASNYCVLAASNGVPKFSTDSGLTWDYLWAPISLYSQSIINISTN